MTAYAQSKKLTDVKGKTREDVVPYYKSLLNLPVDHSEIRRVNELILSKWTSSGLNYIKERAWGLK